MENFDALSLVIISLGAFLLPLVAEKINIPSIVLEIAYGILVGPVLGICLLYTSPSPRDLRASRMPSSA